MPLIVTKTVSERLELVKKVFRIFIRDRVSDARMKNVIEIISCPKNCDSVIEKSKEFLTPMLEQLMQDCLNISAMEKFPFQLFADTFEEFLQGKPLEIDQSFDKRIISFQKMYHTY